MNRGPCRTAIPPIHLNRAELLPRRPRSRPVLESPTAWSAYLQPSHSHLPQPRLWATYSPPIGEPLSSLGNAHLWTNCLDTFDIRFCKKVIDQRIEKRILQGPVKVPEGVFKGFDLWQYNLCLTGCLIGTAGGKRGGLALAFCCF